MAKKKTSVSSRKYKNAQWIKGFAAIGGVLSIVLHALAIFSFFESGSTGDWTPFVLPFLGILVCLVILGSLGLINHDFVIPMEWYTLLTLGIVDAILGANLGTFLIIIAAFIALIDRL